jgi:hypothetical protein
MAQPALRPVDVVLLAKLVSYRGRRPPIAQMSFDLSLGRAEVHSSLKRLEKSSLIADRANGGQPLVSSTQEFLIHGVKYAFPAQRGEISRGIPTSYGAPPLSEYFAETSSDLAPVWPYAEGPKRGASIEPLHKVVPLAALRDPITYELLALIDALRDGRARERQIAARELTSRIASLLHG